VSSSDINGNVEDTSEEPLIFRTKKEKDNKKPKVIKGRLGTNNNLVNKQKLAAKDIGLTR